MAGVVEYRSLLHLGKLSASREESAYKTATSHIRKPSDCAKTYVISYTVE